MVGSNFGTKLKIDDTITFQQERKERSEGGEGSVRRMKELVGIVLVGSQKKLNLGERAGSQVR